MRACPVLHKCTPLQIPHYLIVDVNTVYFFNSRRDLRLEIFKNVHKMNWPWPNSELNTMHQLYKLFEIVYGVERITEVRERKTNTIEN